MSNYFGGYNPTFKFMGRTFGAGDEAAFAKFLKAHGRNLATWSKNHPKKAMTFDPVSQQVYSAYNPQVQAMQRMKTDLMDTYANRFKNLGLFTNSLVGMLGNIPGYVAGPYAGATNAQRTAGNVYGQQLNEDSAARAAGGNKTLEAIGAPGAQTLQGGDAGGALAGLAGWLPAEMLSAQGEAYTNRAKHLPVEAQLTALQMGKDLFDDQGKAVKDWEGQFSDMLSGMPGDRAKIQASYDKQKLAQQTANRKAALDKAKFDMDYWYKKKTLAERAGRLDLAKQAEARYTEAEQRHAAAAEGYAPSGQPLVGTHIDPYTGKPIKDGWHYAPAKGRPVKDATGKKGTGSVVDSPPRIRKSIAADLKSFKVPGQDGKNRRATYSEAFSYLYQKYKSYLKKFGNERKYDRMLDDILRSQGYTAASSSAKSGTPKGGSSGSGGKPVVPTGE